MAVLIELLYQKVLVVEKIVAEIELPQWRTVTVEPPRGGGGGGGGGGGL